MGTQKTVFLEHIAGLRGLAIILVILFHMNGQTWAHAYLGVDVFLVITGYLIFRSRTAHPGIDGLKSTGIYLKKRIERIIPPMTILIILAAAFGFLFLGWWEQRFLFQSGVKACEVHVNLLFKKELENYFTANAAYIPLLHLWYLSVTLQIYLIYAIGNQLIQRFSKRWIIAILTLIGLASLAYHYSFAIHEWLVSMDLPTWKQVRAVSYYETLPRLWEVLAGALVLYLPSCASKPCRATCATAFGLLLLLVPALVGHLPYLSALPLTLLAVAGTVLVIRYAPESRLMPLLCNKALMWVGAISFSVYLVHMPIIVYWRMWAYGQIDLTSYIGMFALSLAVGWIFWWAVEKRRFPLWLTLLLWGITFYTCRLGRKQDGFRHYFPAIEEPAYNEWQDCTDERYTANWNPLLDPLYAVFHSMKQPNPRHHLPPLMYIGHKDAPKSIVLLGDSHAGALYPGLNHVCAEAGIAGLYMYTAVLPFHNWVINLASDYTYSPEKEKALLDWLAAHPELKHVIISQRWTMRFRPPTTCTPEKFETDLRDFLKEMKKIGKNVILVASTPEFPIVDFLRFFRVRQMRSKALEYPTCTPEHHEQQHAQAYAILRKMQKEGMCTLLDPLDALEPGEIFLSVREGKMEMLDDDHMYCGNSIWLIRRLLPRLQKALSQQPDSTEQMQ